MKTLMRIYEAGAVCVYKDATLSLSRAASCGSTSISSLTQGALIIRVDAGTGCLNMLPVQYHQVQLWTRVPSEAKHVYCFY